MSESYPQSVIDSHQLLAEQNPLQLKINQLQEQLYKERERWALEKSELELQHKMLLNRFLGEQASHEDTLKELEAQSSLTIQYSNLLSSLGTQLNDAGFVVPF